MNQKTKFKIIWETVGSEQRKEKSPLRQCAIAEDTLDTIPRGYSLKSIDHLMSDPEWLDHHLTKEHRGHSVEFWADVQEFWAEDANWTRKGNPTAQGAYSYGKLVNRWGFKPMLGKGIAG